MPGILSRTRRERIPTLELGGGNGAPLDVGGTLVLPLEWKRYVGDHLELQPECEAPFGSSRGLVGLASRRLSGNGPHLAWRGEPPGFSRVEAGALDLRRGPQGPALVASGKASPHARCSVVSRDSSPVDARA